MNTREQLIEVVAKAPAAHEGLPLGPGLLESYEEQAAAVVDALGVEQVSVAPAYRITSLESPSESQEEHACWTRRGESQ